MDFIVDMTITGSITAIIILIIKWIFKNKLTPKWHFYIWGILLLRLLMPILPESDLSLFKNIPSSREVIIKEAVEESEVFKNYYEQVEMKNDNNYIVIRSDGFNYITYIWWIGVALLSIYFILIYILFNAKVKRLKKCLDDKILHIFKRCKDDIRVRREVNVLVGSDTPMLTGLLKPKIIIPEGYNYEEIKQIFLHELCHVKYWDVFFNLFSTLLLCIQWFNPIMWVCVFVIRRDIELLCDQRVLEVTNNRRLYAKVLLKTALKKNKFILCTTSMQNGEKEIKKRIKYIASNKKIKLIYSISSIFAIFLVAIICLTNGKDSNAAVIGDNVDVAKDTKFDSPVISDKISTKDKDNLIYVIRKKYVPGSNQAPVYYEVNYYDINEEDVNLASSNELLEYMEYKRLAKDTDDDKDRNKQLQDGTQFIYEKSIKKNQDDKSYTVYSKKKEDGTLVKEIILP